MEKKLVYDLPLRIYHWLFAGLFIAAFFIAKTVDDESPIFSYHMLAGFVLGFTVLLRIVWGFVGTKYSRFRTFALHPKDLFDYIAGIFSGDKRRWVGHNPASSWATFAMLSFALGLGGTGYLMASGQKEAFEDLHELLANGFLVVVLLHIAGVFLHAFRHQDSIGLSMINGEKKDFPDHISLPSSKKGVALIFIVLVISFAVYLVSNFDRQKQTLKFIGTTLKIGENENEEEEGKERADRNQKNNDDEEEDED